MARPPQNAQQANPKNKEADNKHFLSVLMRQILKAFAQMRNILFLPPWNLNLKCAANSATVKYMKRFITIQILAASIFAGLLSAQQPENPSDKYFNTVEVDFVGAEGAKVAMEYPIKKRKDGGWRVRIPKKDLLEETIEGVDIKIPACRAKKGEDGYFITNTSAIGTFRLDNGTFASRRNYYTFFGMKNPRAAWVAIVKKLKLEYELRVEVKNGVYEIFPRFLIKAIEFPPYEDIVVDFYELKGESANYAGMAKKYREYQLKRGEVKPLKERIKNNPKLEMMAKSILLRAQHGAKPIPVDKATGR